MVKNRPITCLLVPPQGAGHSIRETLMKCCVASLSRMRAEQGGRGSASICLGGRSRRIFTSRRFVDVLVSARAPSGLRQVDSALGGSVGRDVSSDGGRGSSLVERGGIFWTGAEIPSSSRLIVASVGGFSPRGTTRSRFWPRSRTRR